MALLGMLAMGVFVGLLASQGTQFADNAENWKKLLAAMLGSCFGGVVVTYMSREMKTAGNAIYLYPVGLLLGYTWFQTPKLAAMIVGPPGIGFWVGLAGAVGNVILSIVAFIFVVPSAARDAGLIKPKENPPTDTATARSQEAAKK